MAFARVLVLVALGQGRDLEVPLGLPDPLPWPAGAPAAAAAELGRSLFFDPVLSADRSVSCASCHRPEHGFASPEALPPGALGRRARRNAPTLFNRVLGHRQMWDGRFGSLEEQVLQPIQDENEMALPLPVALARLEDRAPLRAGFADAFPGEGLKESTLARALAAYVSTLLLGDSPVDRFRAGDGAALTEAERGGLWIFESKGGCWRCHSGANFSDESFHNTGIGVVDGVAEPGRQAVTCLPEDRGRFKTPTLRGLALTGPYMHDGSLATLADVIEHYRRGGNANPGLDPVLRPLDLDERDGANLEAFLRALSRSGDS